jgi:GAF domain-containing protein
VSTNITATIISSVLGRPGARIEKAAKVAELIRQSRNYRWVGLYDVGPELVSIMAYSGPGASAYPQFPVTEGFTAAAIREKKTVVVGDVRTDPRYLTAFGSTLSEIIIPVLDEKSSVVVGTIDVESEQADAFSEGDQQELEECLRVASPLWMRFQV